MILYHGSFEQVRKPSLEKCRLFNDYGRGFYCTLDKNLANEWACKKQNVDGFCNTYQLNETNLRIVNLDSEPFGTLNWIAVLMKNRPFDRAANAPMVEAFVKEYGVELEHIDVVTGYRADDSYFSIARSFAAGTLTDKQAESALRLGNLGKQVVLKSQAAFDALTFLGAEHVDGKIWHSKWFERDSAARDSFQLMNDNLNPSGQRIFDLVGDK